MENYVISKIISQIQDNLKSFNEIDSINDESGIYGIALKSSNFPYFNDNSISALM